MIINLLTPTLAKNPAYVEMLSTDNGSVGAFFPAQWMHTASILSPLIMILIWVFQQWWASRNGIDKKIQEDLDDLKQGFAEMRAMLGTDLDHKIERKIERAFDYYEKGKRSL